MPIGSPQWMYASGGDFTIPYSLRFDNARETNLKRTPSGASNQKTWVVSFWMKLGAAGTGTQRMLFAEFGSLYENTSGVKIQGEQIRVDEYISSYTNDTTGDSKLRDPSAWYHILVAFDTTQTTAADRITIYINGVEETYGSTSPPPEDDEYSVNGANIHKWGCGSVDDEENFDGHLAEVHFFDGASIFSNDSGSANSGFNINSFGERGDYGEWKPKKYDGDAAYGTNGYYLDFADSAAPGNDVSGENNDWTNDGFTANDQMLDSPTNNFATLNPVGSSATLILKNGNLEASKPTTEDDLGVSTIGFSSGKWYWEVKLVQRGEVGVIYDSQYLMAPTVDGYMGTAKAIALIANNSGSSSDLRYDGSVISTSNTSAIATSNDILSVAVDADNEKIWYGVNGTWMNSGNPAGGTGEVKDFSALNSKLMLPVGSLHNSSTDPIIFNFGQDSSFAGTSTAQGNQDSNGIGDFYYTPPSGFLALCTSNLPEPAVTPSEHFNTILYTGNGVSGRAMTGVGFQPDMVWTKSSSAAHRHANTDILIGATNTLCTASTAAFSTDDVFDSLDSDGFTLGNDDASNIDTKTYVAWNWKMGGSGSANTDGNHSAGVTVSANEDAGQSILYYTGDSSSPKTVGHGLTKAPEVWLGKNGNDTGGWYMYHHGTSSPFTKVLYPNTGDPEVSSVPCTAVSATTITFPDGTFTDSPNKMILYAFHSVDGYSKFGSYTGNANADGTFVYCGFRPKLVIVKVISTSDDWYMHDTEREPYNVAKTVLKANTNAAQSTSAGYAIDILSNGFKNRGTDSSHNAAQTYVYMAFAETPFKYSNAR